MGEAQIISMNLRDFHMCVVRPVLDHLEMGGIHAERLVSGTALVETGLSALVQRGGPALGVYQIEPNTLEDVERYLRRRGDIGRKIDKYRTCQDTTEQLITNLAFATAICRVKYWMSPDSLPDDMVGFAKSWKKIYNSPLGAGTEEDFKERAKEIMNLGD